MPQPIPFIKYAHQLDAQIAIVTYSMALNVDSVD